MLDEWRRNRTSSAKLAKSERGPQRKPSAPPRSAPDVVGSCNCVLENRQLMGATLLIGGVLFLALALGTLASSVPPRDRTRAGSIDYGKRN
jgi:hypothetical protein